MRLAFSLMAFGLAVAFACHAAAMLYEKKRIPAIDSSIAALVVVMIYLMTLVFDGR